MALQKLVKEAKILTSSIPLIYNDHLHQNASLYIKCIILACLPLATILSDTSFRALKNAISNHSARLYQGASSLTRVILLYARKYIPEFEWLQRLRWGSPYKKYGSPEEEELYWRQAESGLRELAYSDARFVRTTVRPGKNGKPYVDVPNIVHRERQILYYTPRLLPEYREKRGVDLEAQEIRIPSTTFLKWFRLTFPEKPTPTLLQAEKLMKQLSNRDLHEVQRMARSVSYEKALNVLDTESSERAFLCDDEYAESGIWRYRRKWIKWLMSKGPDTAIVFEEDTKPTCWVKH